MPWLVVDVQWSPFAARDYWVVSTANHRALVWNLNLRDDSSSGAIEHSLHGHSRAITDVNFSAHHPDLLATCSVDGYVHWWDLRRPRQPVLTFCDWFAGATQVKFSRRDPHILASSHERWLRIWDERRASQPLKSISAHTSKIYGLDWNRTKASAIVTCSLDQSIKFWDYNKEGDEPEHVIRTDYPVWRARHTPFGWGLLAMPQNEPGDLYLYDRLWSKDSKDQPSEAAQKPVAVFPGHGDHKAKEFLWRSRGGISEDNLDSREFQLVSWGTDNELRLHCIDTSILATVGHKKDGPARDGLILTRKGAAYKTFRTIDDNSNRDRRTGTMKDPRTGAGSINHKQSALTAGMRSAASFNRQMRPAWHGPSMKAKVAPNKNSDRNQSQIGWMKGITMTKRKASSDVSRRLVSKDSTILGHGYPDDQWGEPDTIQEELLRVSTQIPKVKWENINMDNLTLTASLNGPWGVDGETIFIKVKIDIPTDYPKLRAPKFFVEKTTFMPDRMHRRINREIHQLAEQFLLRKQNCLEVAFTYLLGEVDLETSTTFFKNVRDLDDDLDGLGDDSSSEDDDHIAAGGSTSMSQELTPHPDADTTIAPPTRVIMPPPPLTCGARFSHDGKLVCFFPTKEEKARVLFSTSADIYKERPKGEPFFAGFGRLTHDLPPRQKYMTDEASATDDQSDSYESDASSSSSGSESTSIHKMSLWYHSNRQLRKTWSEDRSIRSSGGGTGTGVGTGTGTGTSRRRLGRSRNLICIHDLRADLPSKREFAQEYAIFGDGAQVCEHNAQVAEKYGYADLRDVWHYLALLLRKGIPLEVLESNQRRSSILVIARDVVVQCRQNDNNGLSAMNGSLTQDHNLLGRVKWGQHPLAKDFIQELFVYFEKIADIQMLAMLSCIFSESSADDSVAYAESQLPQQETPLPLKAPSFSLDYYPTDATVWNIYSRGQTGSVVTTPGTLHTPVHYAGSHTSDDVVWGGDPGTNSYSCGETPPSKGRPFMGEVDAPSHLSKSPTNRAFAKVNSGFASAFAANLPRSFTGGSSSSPPVGQSRKRPSPAEAILNSLAPRAGNVSTGAATAVGDSGGRNSISDDDYRREDMMSLVPVSVSVFVEDQTMFDDDGWLSTPLLEPSRICLHANYRYAYAEMLQMWGQPLARLEVMKFNVLKDDLSAGGADGSFHDSLTMHDGASGGVSHPKTGSSPIIMGKKDQLHTLVASGRGLDITGVCRVHETQLEPLRYTSSDSKVGGAVGTCDRCHRVQNQLRCVYCLEPVDALFPPCLSCGCASHEECLAEWHASGETYCPAGDECNCVEEAMNGQVESWAALRGAMMKGHQQLTELPSAAIDDSSDDDDDGRAEVGDWERVAKDVPSRVQGASPSPVSLSFVRLKKSAGTWSRASSQRRNGKKT